MSLIPLLTGRQAFNATGGTIYTQGGYVYHMFTSDGSFAVLSGRTTLQIIAVAGGGAGGRALTTTGTSNYSYGGGGGGGGVVATTYQSVSLQISIGIGGSVSTSGFGPGNGGTTQILTNPGGMGSPVLILNANGGGAGADPSVALPANNGSSGGGAGIKRISSVITNYAAGTGDGVTGFNGGTVITGTGTSAGGGPGGGSASAGGSGPLAVGLGTTAYSSWFNSGSGSLSNGGRGGRLVSDMIVTNYGDGGKGGASYNSAVYTPDSGASGVVVIRYPV
jgi:hypothetical protein